MACRIPQIGLGTMTLKGDVCVQAVKTALQLGYRHLDTAAFYGNEVENGEGLRALRRQARGRAHLHQGAREQPAAGKFRTGSFDESLQKLRLPWVDLLLIHWGNPTVPLAETRWTECKTKKDGRAKHVGVANFTTAMLDEATRHSRLSRWSPTRSRCTPSSINRRCWQPAASSACR